MPETKKIELRSDEVQEIMSQVPHWMIRRGIGLILLLIVMCFFITWFIKYPDVISGSATLTTQHPTILLLTKNAGEISELYLDDHHIVKKGELIALVENTITEEAREYLNEIVYTVQKEIPKGSMEIKFADSGYTFGALQSDYSNLKNTVLEYQYFLKNNTLSTELSILSEQIQNYLSLRALNQEQLVAAKNQQIRLSEKLKSDKRLLDQDVISKAEYNNELNKMNASESEISNLKKNSVQSSITLTDLKKQQFQLKTTFEKQKNDLLNAIQLHLKTIENALDNWGRNFEIRALIEGELCFLDKIVENQYVTAGQQLFAIVPKDENYIGYILVPQIGFSKIRRGQSVRLKMDNYPSYEFGQLNAKVSSISLLPKEKQYRVEFKLTNGMVSSYKKKFKYTPEMSGTADIITDDLRLTDRIFNKIAKIFKK